MGDTQEIDLDAVEAAYQAACAEAADQRAAAGEMELPGCDGPYPF
jgi:hypothetical protein